MHELSLPADRCVQDVTNHGPVGRTAATRVIERPDTKKPLEPLFISVDAGDTAVLWATLEVPPALLADRRWVHSRLDGG